MNCCRLHRGWIVAIGSLACGRFPALGDDARLPDAANAGAPEEPPGCKPPPALERLDSRLDDLVSSPSGCFISFLSPTPGVEGRSAPDSLKLASLDLHQRWTLAPATRYAQFTPGGWLVHDEIGDPFEAFGRFVAREGEGRGEAIALLDGYIWYPPMIEGNRLLLRNGDPTAPDRVYGVDLNSSLRPTVIAEKAYVIGVGTDDHGMVWALLSEAVAPAPDCRDQQGSLSWATFDAAIRQPVASAASVVASHPGTGRVVYTTVAEDGSWDYTVAFPRERRTPRRLFALPPLQKALDVCSGEYARVAFAPDGRRLVVQRGSRQYDVISESESVDVYDLNGPAAHPSMTLTCRNLRPPDSLSNDGILCQNRDEPSWPLEWLGFDGSRRVLDTDTISLIRMPGDRWVYERWGDRAAHPQPEIKLLALTREGSSITTLADGFLDSVNGNQYGPDQDRWIFLSDAYDATNVTNVHWSVHDLATGLTHPVPYRPWRVVANGRAIAYQGREALLGPFPPE